MNDLLQTPAQQSQVSIATSAMLVELSIGVWTARKKDRKQTSKVVRDNNAASDAASVHKNLLTGCDELTAITKLTGNIRNRHYAMTMPWSDGGARLIPTTTYPEYVNVMSALEQEWQSLVEQFLTNYHSHVVAAQAKLGSMFSRDEYPTTDAIRAKFHFLMTPMPVPEAGDFRVDVGTEAMADLQTRYNDFYQSRIQTAMQDTWQRVYKVLTTMSERLDYVGKDDKKIFRDSLVTNAHDMVDVLRSFNITGDTQMSAMADRLEHALRGVTAGSLRNSDYHRAETKRAVDAAIKALPSLEI